MSVRTKTIAALAAASMMAAPALAMAAPAPPVIGTPLAAVLEADANKDGTPSFDQNGKDFDILFGAVQAVLTEDSESAVSVLADPEVRLTAFIPTDRAFKRTAEALGVTASTEKRLLNKIARTFGIAGVEEILLYHVVPGQKLTSPKVVAAGDGTRLTMANGQTTVLKIRDDGTIRLRDKVTAVPNPKVIAVDINRSKVNNQVAHVINGVLLPSL